MLQPALLMDEDATSSEDHGKQLQSLKVRFIDWWLSSTLKLACSEEPSLLLWLLEALSVTLTRLSLVAVVPLASMGKNCSSTAMGNEEVAAVLSTLVPDRDSKLATESVLLASALALPFKRLLGPTMHFDSPVPSFSPATAAAAAAPAAVAVF